MKSSRPRLSIPRAGKIRAVCHCSKCLLSFAKAFETHWRDFEDAWSIIETFWCKLSKIEQNWARSNIFLNWHWRDFEDVWSIIETFRCKLSKIEQYWARSNIFLNWKQLSWDKKLNSIRNRQLENGIIFILSIVILRLPFSIEHIWAGRLRGLLRSIWCRGGAHSRGAGRQDDWHLETPLLVQGNWSAQAASRWNRPLGNPGGFGRQVGGFGWGPHQDGQESDSAPTCQDVPVSAVETTILKFKSKYDYIGHADSV